MTSNNLEETDKTSSQATLNDNKKNQLSHRNEHLKENASAAGQQLTFGACAGL